MNHLNNINACDADLKELRNNLSTEEYNEALEKIKEGYPIQYLIGNVNFYGNKILVNENVLIPRYETEFLVDLIKNKLDKNNSYNILDIGTGSGCISISLSKIFSNSNITGIDISNGAIEVANKNKEINNVDNVTFINNDLSNINSFDGYDIIVSNPPYVSYNEEVGIETKYEPQNAIFADDNGLYFYKEIIKKASLSKVKAIFFEIGANQKEEIYKIKDQYLKEYHVETFKDLANKDRYIYIFE